MKNKFFLSLLLLLFSIVAFGQQREFDKMKFIIGKWECKTKRLMANGSYFEQTRFSDVNYIFGGNALIDNFGSIKADGSMLSFGSTVRSFDAVARKWKMVYYSNDLSIVTQMVGDYEDGEFHFDAEGTDRQGAYQARITFYNISENEYSWKNDKSYDGGKTWMKNFFTYTASRIEGDFESLDAVDLSESTLQSYEGSYQSEGTNLIKVEISGKELLVNGTVLLMPYSKHKFADKNDTQKRFYFKIGQDNEVLGFGMESGPQGAWELQKKDG